MKKIIDGMKEKIKANGDILDSIIINEDRKDKVNLRRPTRYDLSFDDAIILAKGSRDYGGGFHDEEYEAYQAGIDTVVSVLEKAKEDGINDFQMEAVYGIGKES